MWRPRGSRQRMVLATGACSIFLLVYYLQGDSSPASHSDVSSRRQGKSGRGPLQSLHYADQGHGELKPNPAIQGHVQSAVHATHQGRRELLKEACRSHTKKRRVLIPEDLKHLIVDDKHKMLYCYVPKVACTNWKRVLMVLTGKGHHSDPLKIPANEAHVPGNLRTLSEYPTSEINRRLRSYLKFIFVREPFERLVSAYRNKFTRRYNNAFHKRYGTKIIRRHRADPQPEALERGDDVSFEEFVYYLVDPHTQREEPFNEHWERIHSLCHPCLIHYDVIGKYETLEQDSRYVLQLAGVDSQVQFPTTGKHTRTTGDMAAQFFNNISPFYQRKLYNLYRMDFLLFNYSVPSYLTFR
ncbi:carbohydrate sulfotransferase 11-like isoform X1 [Scleropages formosus]|uniref:Carbohydrate sulfotransferase n=1 Tax=Scleropages formosus TaxID=113540 RepID=A0A8C9S1Q8_SCLFO|nr:carbohydrate sulfotransferase 11-like isoform X1 [Scleropages formosus]